MYKKNKKGELTLRYLINWAMCVFVYLSVVVGIVVYARESVLSILNTTETIMASLLVIAPIGGLIYDLFETKNKISNYNDYEDF